MPVEYRPDTVDALKDLFVVFRSLAYRKYPSSARCSPSDIVFKMKDIYGLGKRRKSQRVSYANFHVSNPIQCFNKAEIQSIMDTLNVGEEEEDTDSLEQVPKKKEADWFPHNSIQSEFCRLAKCEAHQIPILEVGVWHQVFLRNINTQQITLYTSVKHSGVEVLKEDDYYRVSIHSMKPLNLRFTMNAVNSNGQVKFQLISLRIVDSRDVQYYRDNAPSRPYVRKSRQIRPESNNIVPGEAPEVMRVQFKGQLERYQIPSNVQQALNERKSLSKVFGLPKALSVDSFQSFHSFALWAEEMQMDRDIRMFDKTGVGLERIGRGGYLRLKVEGLAEKRPSVLYGKFRMTVLV